MRSRPRTAWLLNSAPSSLNVKWFAPRITTRSLLVAGWLYWQGTTVVKGFALVLIVGVLVSMFSAVTVTRTMLRRVTRTSWGRNIELYHVER